MYVCMYVCMCILVCMHISVYLIHLLIYLHELWFLFVFVWMEIRKPFRRTLARDGLASPGLNFPIASAAPFRNDVSVSLRGLLPHVRAQVLRRLLAWTNHTHSFNHQQRSIIWNADARPLTESVRRHKQAHLKRLLGGLWLRLLI